METKVLMKMLVGIVNKWQPYDDSTNAIVGCWEQYRKTGKCRNLLMPTTDFIPVINGLLEEIVRLKGPVGVASSMTIVLRCPYCYNKRKWEVHNPPTDEVPKCNNCWRELNPEKDVVSRRP